MSAGLCGLVVFVGCGPATVEPVGHGGTNAAPGTATVPPDDGGGEVTNADEVVGGEGTNHVVPEPVDLPVRVRTDPISVSTLKGLLPTTVQGFNFDREQMATQVQHRVRTTFAQKVFVTDDRTQTLVYRLVDTHKMEATTNMSQILTSPDLEVDNEQVYEKVSEYGGLPCYEKDLKGRGLVKYQVLAGARVLVELTGVGIGLDDLEPFLDYYDLERIGGHAEEAARRDAQRLHEAQERVRKAAGGG